ncbi:unnamed protein product [Allacma fusca]|uniref:Uncharacterized protein n=1 Tax=Allacma fusca TaxID=39272 RepID=A0A8J2P2Q2_9HEXA|nr:unnamed protein product [Allacma fusca]
MKSLSFLLLVTVAALASGAPQPGNVVPSEDLETAQSGYGGFGVGFAPAIVGYVRSSPAVHYAARAIGGHALLTAGAYLGLHAPVGLSYGLGYSPVGYGYGDGYYPSYGYDQGYGHGYGHGHGHY